MFFITYTGAILDYINRFEIIFEDNEVVPGLGNGGNPFPDGLGYLAQLVYLDRPSAITGKVAQIQVA